MVEHWLKANLNMLQLTMKSLEYQRSLLKGGERAAGAAGRDAGDAQNPAMWAWNMMARAGQDAMGSAAKAAEPAGTGAKRRKGRKPG